MYEKLIYIIDRSVYISSSCRIYGEHSGHVKIYYYCFESECKHRRIEIHTDFSVENYTQFAKTFDGHYYNAYINPWLNNVESISNTYRVDSFKRIQCPHCNQYFDLGDADIDFFVTCKYCLKTTINTFKTSEEEYVMEVFDRTSQFTILQFIRKIGKKMHNLTQFTDKERENVMSLLYSTEINIDYKKLKKVFDKCK